jgi:hypothetical protein
MEIPARSILYVDSHLNLNLTYIASRGFFLAAFEAKGD